MSSTESPTMPTINSPNLIAPPHPSCIKQHPSFLINFFVISLHHSLPFLMVKVYFILFLFLLSYHHFSPSHLSFLSYLAIVVNTEPKPYFETKRSLEQCKCNVMQSKIYAPCENKTWSLVPFLARKETIVVHGSINQIKLNFEGSIEQYKTQTRC